jgi:predicted PurR-regulated permease PerM
MSIESVGDEPTESNLRALPGPATGVDKAAFVLMAAAVLFVFVFHLVGAVVAGLLTHMLLVRGARRLRGSKLSHGASKFVAAALLGTLAAGASAAFVVLTLGFVRGRIGNLPGLFEKLADVLDQVRSQLESMGYSAPWMEQLNDDALHHVLSRWLRGHAELVSRAGRQAGVFLLHDLLGILLGMILFFRHVSSEPARPLAAALAERMRRLADAFDRVVLAQVEVSALNTSVTAVYLLVVLPLAGARLPLSGTLLLLTFLTGLLPLIGNVLSVGAIVLVALGVSFKVAVVSLIFFLVLHKLLYFINARIVGSRVGAGAWEILLAMMAMEAAFGLPGLVLAPILYAYLKQELKDRALV